MKYEEVIAVLDDTLLLLSNHRCVADLKDKVTGFKKYIEILHGLCLQGATPDRDGESQFTRCFLSDKTFVNYQSMLDEVRRRTTAQLTTGMPMFRQKARRSIALRNKQLLKKKQ